MRKLGQVVVDDIRLVGVQRQIVLVIVLGAKNAFSGVTSV
jgi:hypothetical protein